VTSIATSRTTLGLSLLLCAAPSAASPPPHPYRPAYVVAAVEDSLAQSELDAIHNLIDHITLAVDATQSTTH